MFPTSLCSLPLVLALGACTARADTVAGSSPAWALVTGLRQLNPIDDCISVPDGEGLFLVQPDVAELSFQGTAVSVQGGGGIALFSLDGAQNITSSDTGAQQCVQIAQWTGLDPGAPHILRVEAQELVRAVAIAQVSIEGGTASTTPPPPSSTTEPPGSTSSSSTPTPPVCTTSPPPPSTSPQGGGPPPTTSSTSSATAPGTPIPPATESTQGPTPTGSARVLAAPVFHVAVLALLLALALNVV